MSDNVLVSVIVLAYNHEKYLAEALDSLLSQRTDFGFEILIGEDRSKDDSLRIALDYQRRHPDIVKVIYDEVNVGMNENLARLLDASKGQYIAVCEGDDYWIDPDKLAEQVALLARRPEVSLVFTDRRVKQGERFHEARFASRDYTSSDVLEGFIPPTQTMMWRHTRSLVKEVRKHVGNPSGDRLIAYHCASFGVIAHLPIVSAVYRVTGEGVWSSTDPRGRRRTKYQHLGDFHRRMGLEGHPALRACARALLLDALHDVRRGERNALRDVGYFAHVLGARESVAAVLRKVASRR